VTILDIHGRVVIWYEENDLLSQPDVSNLQPGTYYLLVGSGNRTYGSGIVKL
jgi:hypothetical protein